MLAQHPPPDSLSDVAVQAHMPMVPRPNPFSAKANLFMRRLRSAAVNEKMAVPSVGFRVYRRNYELSRCQDGASTDDMSVQVLFLSVLFFLFQSKHRTNNDSSCNYNFKFSIRGVYRLG